MEWLWQVNDCDEPVGKVRRDVAHAQAIRHRSGVVFLVDAADRIYLTRRAATKAIFPDTYDTSASFHVAYGESYLEAAGRESLEELGIDKPVVWLGKFSHDDPPEHQFVAVFSMVYAGEPIVLDDLEADGGSFHSSAELGRIVQAERCTPWLRDSAGLLLESLRRRGA